MMDYDRAHKVLSDVFTQLNLSYRFTSCLLTPLEADSVAAAAALRLYGSREAPECNTASLCLFTFSKPENRHPRPEASVDMYVEYIEGDPSTGCCKYLIRAEGQHYSRTLVVDPSNITGDEFNEKLIDKVYQQKMVVFKDLSKGYFGKNEKKARETVLSQ